MPGLTASNIQSGPGQDTGAQGQGGMQGHVPELRPILLFSIRDLTAHACSLQAGKLLRPDRDAEVGSKANLGARLRVSWGRARETTTGPGVE